MKRIGLILLVCLAVALAAGCAKKRQDSMPPGATTTQGGEDVQVTWDEQQLTEEQLRAQQKSQSIEDLKTRIHFAFDKSDLTNESRSILKRKSEIMEVYPNLTLVIEGHCDERGTVEYNLALGDRRARAAYEYLKALGVSESRLSIVSFGEEKPLDPGHDESAWSMNRRDEFRVFE